jgi:PadR family transcriptional regulator, regulatory protein AphA
VSLSFALLGLLDEKASSGYDLARRFDLGVGAFAWGAGHSQIYPELKRLSERGLIEVASVGARGRKVYEVTSIGREELRTWLLHPSAERGTVRNEFLLRLFLLRSLQLSETLQVLSEVEVYAAAQVGEMRAEQQDLPTEAAGAALAATYGVFTYAAVRDWAHWVADRLRDGEDLSRVLIPPELLNGGPGGAA